MNIKAILGLIVGLAIIGGGAWYFSGKGAPATGTEEGATETADAKSGTGTLGALIALGGSLTCEVTMPTAGGESTGTVYISGGQVRSDVRAAVNGRQMEAHMIKSGDYFYSWTDAYPQGVKVKIAATASGSSSGSGYDPNQQVKYSCAPWAADASKFAVPTTVTFIDASAMGGAGVAAPAPY